MGIVVGAAVFGVGAAAFAPTAFVAVALAGDGAGADATAGTAYVVDVAFWAGLNSSAA